MSRAIKLERPTPSARTLECTESTALQYLSAVLRTRLTVISKLCCKDNAPEPHASPS